MASFTRNRFGLGGRFDEAIVAYVRRTQGNLIGDATAERIKQEIGSAYPSDEVREIDVRGRNLAAGVPRSFALTNGTFLKRFRNPFHGCAGGEKRAGTNTARAGLGYRRGGHGAYRRRLHAPGPRSATLGETGLPVLIAEDPLTCSPGGGKALELMDAAGTLDLLASE